jgi:hypothetical protein
MTIAAGKSVDGLAYYEVFHSHTLVLMYEFMYLEYPRILLK